VWCSDDGVGTPHSLVHDLAGTQINEFDEALLSIRKYLAVDHDIFGLEISVDDTLALEILQAKQEAGDVETTEFGVE
jgi:hypothetical protein